MKTSLLIAMVLTCTTSLALAANKPEKSEHALTVGTEQAVGSGSTAEQKSVKPEKTHETHNPEHDMTVGNEKAAASGSTAESKTVKQAQPHSNKGKHKAKGHDK